MPKPTRGRLAFSYTGFNSTVERFLHARKGEVDERTKLGIARSFQEAAVGQLEEKLVLGMRQCAREGIRVRCLVVSGGVASNQYLRERWVMLVSFEVSDLRLLMVMIRLRACLDKENPDEHVPLVFPPPSLCTGAFRVYEYLTNAD